MTPIRVAVGLMLITGVISFLVGRGANPAILLALPLIAAGFISSNRGAR